LRLKLKQVASEIAAREGALHRAARGPPPRCADAPRGRIQAARSVSFSAHLDSQRDESFECAVLDLPDSYEVEKNSAPPRARTLNRDPNRRDQRFGGQRWGRVTALDEAVAPAVATRPAQVRRFAVTRIGGQKTEDRK